MAGKGRPIQEWEEELLQVFSAWKGKSKGTDGSFPFENPFEVKGGKGKHGKKGPESFVPPEPKWSPPMSAAPAPSGPLQPGAVGEGPALAATPAESTGTASTAVAASPTAAEEFVEVKVDEPEEVHGDGRPPKAKASKEKEDPKKEDEDGEKKEAKAPGPAAGAKASATIAKVSGSVAKAIAKTPPKQAPKPAGPAAETASIPRRNPPGSNSLGSKQAAPPPPPPQAKPKPVEGLIF